VYERHSKTPLRTAPLRPPSWAADWDRLEAAHWAACVERDHGLASPRKVLNPNYLPSETRDGSTGVGSPYCSANGFVLTVGRRIPLPHVIKKAMRKTQRRSLTSSCARPLPPSKAPTRSSHGSSLYALGRLTDVFFLSPSSASWCCPQLFFH